MLIASVQGMMACPVCSGAFSWREDLLHHFGAVHHLEELISHLDYEFTSKSCPPCCRVPRSLFKKHRPQPANSVPASERAENHPDSTKCLKTEFPAGLSRWSDDAHSDGSSITDVVDGGDSVNRVLNSDRPIERYHCDICEFSANDIRLLVEHSSKHAARETASPGRLFEEVRVQPSHDPSSDVSHRMQVQDRYACDRCPFLAKHQGGLHMHMTAHVRSASVTVGFRCGYCDMASPYRASINAHLVSAHHDQPVKIFHFSGEQVIRVLHDYHSGSKTVKFSTAGGVEKRGRLKLSKSKAVATKRNSCSSGKSPTSSQAQSSSSVNTPLLNGGREGSAATKGDSFEKTPTQSSSSMNTQVLNCDKECSDETLERQLPAKMIYRRPVRCPACDFQSCARVNLVRHIRLAHGGHQQSLHTSSVKYSSTKVIRGNCGNVDRDEPTYPPFQV